MYIKNFMAAALIALHTSSAFCVSKETIKENLNAAFNCLADWCVSDVDTIVFAGAGAYGVYAMNSHQQRALKKPLLDLSLPSQETMWESAPPSTELPAPPLPMHFTLTIESQGTVKNQEFELKLIPDNGDCGYIILGITRQEAVKLFTESRAIRKLSADQIVTEEQRHARSQSVIVDIALEGIYRDSNVENSDENFEDLVLKPMKEKTWLDSDTMNALAVLLNYKILIYHHEGERLTPPMEIGVFVNPKRTIHVLHCREFTHYNELIPVTIEGCSAHV